MARGRKGNFSESEDRRLPWERFSTGTGCPGAFAVSVTADMQNLAGQGLE